MSKKEKRTRQWFSFWKIPYFICIFLSIYSTINTKKNVDYITEPK